MAWGLPKNWFGWGLLIGMVTLVPSCSQESTSDSLDIFAQDADGKRRRQAQGDELLWTISMRGCTGHLIAPDYMMTAHHCRPRPGASYRSGSAIKNGRGRDITVESIVDSSPAYSGLDYAILKIRWQGPMPKDQKFPPLIATKESDLQMGTGDGQGDLIFTVGFPGDQQRATYSEGRAKRPSGGVLQYNIGIINGNSGGGVWRKSDGMLVSLTNGGPRMLGQQGWKGGDKNNSGHWNHGAAMWHVYARSQILQDIFPGGRNRFATGPTEPQNQPPKLYLAIGNPDHAASDAFQMIVSAPQSVAQVVMCQSQTACKTDSTGYTPATQDGEKNSRKFYFTNTAVALQSGAVWSLTALDSSGQTLGFQAVQFNAKP